MESLRDNQAQTPLQTLSYYTDHTPALRSVVKTLCWASMAYAILHLVSYRMNWEWALGEYSTPWVAMVIALTHTSVIAGSIASLWFRPYGRWLLICSCGASVTLSLLTWIIPHGFNFSSLFTAKQGDEIVEMFTFWMATAILPIVVILVMIQTGVRALFTGVGTATQTPAVRPVWRRLLSLNAAAMIAVIAIPTVAIGLQSRHCEYSAKNMSLQSTLQTVRCQIELFHIQHGDQWPKLIAHGWPDLMGTTTFHGETCGPYLQAIPINPLTMGTTLGDSAKPGISWVYNDTNGDFQACDADGSLSSY